MENKSLFVDMNIEFFMLNVCINNIIALFIQYMYLINNVCFNEK